jgi:hypothetical protein
MGSLAAGATYLCRIRNNIVTGAGRVTLVGHRGRQRLEQPPLVHAALPAAVRRGIFISRQLNADIKMYDYNYLLEIRNPPIDIPAGVSLEEVGRGRTFTLYRIDQRTAHQSSEPWSGAVLERLRASSPDPTVVVFPNGRDSDTR